MGDRTGIEWTDATWNPVTGCTKVSTGCDNCYAETLAERFRGTPGHYYERGFDVVLRPEKLDQPLRWTRPRMVFVNSMSDLFHDEIPDEYIAKVFAVMAAARQHTFQVLTKRHGRMRSLLSNPGFQDLLAVAWFEIPKEQRPGSLIEWPLPNVWLGVSVEDQKAAELRVPALLSTPAEVRWVSAEPLLGPVNLRAIEYRGGVLDALGGDYGDGMSVYAAAPACLDWVVSGGESGRGARPVHPDWVRGLRDQCAATSRAFLHKQWGEHLPVQLIDDPAWAGGRRFPGKNGMTAAVIREPSTHAFHSGIERPLRAGDVNGNGVMLDDNVIALKVGKKNAGRELDGQIHDGYPAAVTTRGARA